MKLRKQRRRTIRAMRNLAVLPMVGEPETWIIAADAAGNVSQPVRLRHEGLTPDREYAIAVRHTVTTDHGHGQLTTWVTEASKLRR